MNHKPNTLLKVCSVLTIIVGVLAIIGGILVIAFGGATALNADQLGQSVGATTVNGQTYSGSDVTAAVATLGIIVGVFMLITGIFNLILGICGVRGKFKAVKVLVWVVIILDVLSCISSITQGGDVVTALISLIVSAIFPVLMLVGASQSQKVMY